MQRKSFTEFKIISPRIRIVILLVAALIVIMLIASVTKFTSPERSIASYCKAYKVENAKLSNTNGSTYGVTVFSNKSNNPRDFISAFSKLEQVAPDDIRPDVIALKQVFQKIDNDSSQALNASLSGISAESNVKNWTTSHCGS